MDGNEKIEYEQASEDWRHRDSLTWQLPTVLITAGGVLVVEAINLLNTHPLLTKLIITLAFLLTSSLTISLGQNLKLQRLNREIIESLYLRTKRFVFIKWGSFTLLGLSIIMSIFLGVVCIAAWIDKLSLFK